MGEGSIVHEEILWGDRVAREMKWNVCMNMNFIWWVKIDAVAVDVVSIGYCLLAFLLAQGLTGGWWDETVSGWINIISMHPDRESFFSNLSNRSSSGICQFCMMSSISFVAGPSLDYCYECWTFSYSWTLSGVYQCHVENQKQLEYLHAPILTVFQEVI